MVFQVTVPVGEAQPGETAPRRYYKYKDAPITLPPGYKSRTVFEFADEAMATHGNNNAIGYRDLIDVHVETKKITKIVDGEKVQVDKDWLYYELTPYKYITFNEFRSLYHNYGKGLIKLGLQPNQAERFHIYAGTSYKWMSSFLAAQTQGIPVVTAYDTLGEAGLIHSLEQTGSVGVFTDNALLGTLINPVKKCLAIRYIIHSEPILESDKRHGGKMYKDAADAVAKLKEVNPKLVIMSFDEVIQLGRDAGDSIPTNPPKPEDLACIMYTSGSTGAPKGVVLKHENIIAGIAGLSGIVDNKNVTCDDTVIAFLPLAHIFEMVFELVTFYWGAVLGYATVKTLTDASLRNCEGDMKVLKPTMMVGVAAVWESVKKGILAQVAKQPGYAQKVFWGAYKTKNAMTAKGIPGTGIIDNIIFKKVKLATGGRLRLTMNGGSPISADTQKFISTLICPMLLGYGLTETCANTTLVDPAHFVQGVAGAVTGSITVKLIDVAEAGYFAKNNQGEVLIRGKAVTEEYYKNPEETGKAFNSEGWFCTGDIGEWTANGYLKLVDRKKNLVKTLNGEYIALEKLESIYRSNTNVINICCYADANHSKPMGIVVPNEPAIRQLATDLKLYSDVTSVEMHELCANQKLSKAVTDSLLKTGKSQALVGIELLVGIVLVDEEWTPQNGFVTSAQKLQRKKILESVQTEVDALYARN
ncbi:hypothetical protein BABINDRAFT_6441 [Babjeviella inositovora NRRL Y-12698]|uniref:AMP-dependent synthetase/ligase domain-containing protein n=1 Tax=Babjeviella inositovora NRRL Y-12698 TaxID=984486 RepID=A0A1E3QVW2_9ASCO|nr:uncharacterized protein BABINDRAFT_6441 [Babjeviella inositovora NRRL Y-12698]ODQ81793.1 hypothetical protein BABINDRAFT_6441 [Babjeviella inositovora NRRL Y-12698]